MSQRFCPLSNRCERTTSRQPKYWANRSSVVTGFAVELSLELRHFDLRAPCQAAAQASWTLLDADWGLVANKAGATRLGFALRPGHFGAAGGSGTQGRR